MSDYTCLSIKDITIFDNYYCTKRQVPWPDGASLRYESNTCLDASPYPYVGIMPKDPRNRDDTIEYKIPLVSTPLHYGGIRRWFRCPMPKCGKRVSKLYMPTIRREVLACRQCCNLSYESQYESELIRLVRECHKVRKRLNIANPTLEPKKPRHMHQKTYHRLLDKLNCLDKKILSLSHLKILEKKSKGHSPLRGLAEVLKVTRYYA